jgi:hypothetical protein
LVVFTYSEDDVAGGTDGIRDKLRNFFYTLHRDFDEIRSWLNPSPTGSDPLTSAGPSDDQGVPVVVEQEEEIVTDVL